MSRRSRIYKSERIRMCPKLTNLRHCSFVLKRRTLCKSAWFFIFSRDNEQKQVKVCKCQRKKQGYMDRTYQAKPRRKRLNGTKMKGHKFQVKEVKCQVKGYERALFFAETHTSRLMVKAFAHGEDLSLSLSNVFI